MKSNNTYVAIMAGGIGSRFWPGSRTSRPKQFLDILGTGKSLIRLTFERFLKLTVAENIYIVTNKIYKDLVKEHLPELGDHQILCEPTRNNTAPCVAYTAFKLQATNPEANFIVAPSDHIILKEQEFVDALSKALDFTAKEDTLVTLGITPTRPDTGYGYINYKREGNNGIHKVNDFKEKPNKETAQTYLDSGDYVWNAGIFVWRANTIISEFQKHAQEIYDIFYNINDVFNTENEQATIDEEYPKTPSISIDYAIMENADNIYTLPVDIGWSDLGTWNSLHAEYEKDEDNNAVYSDNVMLYDTQNCLIRTPKDKLTVIKGMDNFIIVDDGNVLLIYPKDKEQEIKAITKEIGAAGKTAFL